MTVSGEIGRETAPALKTGAATLVVHATRPVLFGLRQVSSTFRKDLQVRLTPPTVTVLSQFHFINQGGAEIVVYQVNPADVESGVRVGELEYPGMPAAGAGIPNAAPGLRVAFFPFLFNQPPSTPVSLWARDEAGNAGRGEPGLEGQSEGSSARARSRSTMRSCRRWCRQSCRTRRTCR